MPSPRGDVNFSIQLLSGNNVVLVECPGFESELFMPQILNERICFQNIIPNRRCCSLANVTMKPLIYKPSTNSGRGRNKHNSSSNVLQPVISPQIMDPLFISPVAKSTPSKQLQRMPGGKENAENLSKSKSASLNMPELMRDAIGASMLESHLEMPPLMRNEVPFASIQNANLRNITRESINADANDSGFNLPSTPDNSYRFANVSSNEGSIVDKGNSISKIQANNVWRKVITPTRTYSRRNQKSSPVKSVYTTPPQKKKQKVTTKPPNPAFKLDVRNRKLIIDTKKTLPVHAILNKTIETPAVLKRKSAKKVASAKTRKQYESLKTTAFDMLTTSNQAHYATKLQNQFRNCCIGKASTTHPQYKTLTDIPELIVDKQIRNMRKQFRSTLHDKPPLKRSTSKVNSTSYAPSASANNNADADADVETNEKAYASVASTSTISSVVEANTSSIIMSLPTPKIKPKAHAVKRVN